MSSDHNIIWQSRYPVYSFLYRICGSYALYDTIFVHTKNIYEDFIANNAEDWTVDNLDLVCQALGAIQETFGTFLFIQISENAVLFTIWAYLAVVENTYIFCATMALIR